MIIVITTCPVFAAVSRAQIHSWIQACDRSQGDDENCRRSTCLRALKHLVKPKTRHAYETLGMGTMSELDDYIRLYDYCQSRHVTTAKPHVGARDWTIKHLALKTYRDMHGHVRVPRSFIVPTDDSRWPIETHGLKLGNAVHHLRERKAGLAQSQLDDLEALGFEWKSSLEEIWTKTLLALTNYADIHGHMRVPQRFIVPTDDPRWPEEMHGIKLGKVVSDLRRRKDTLPQHRINALNFFGFEWTVLR
jgi:hypothetical protein